MATEGDLIRGKSLNRYIEEENNIEKRKTLQSEYK